MLLLLLACAHRMQVASHPVGAVVLLDGHVVGQTPIEVAVPLRGADLSVELGGYRTFTRHITWWTRRRFEVRLVTEHGPAGTWAPEDVK